MRPDDTPIPAPRDGEAWAHTGDDRVLHTNRDWAVRQIVTLLAGTTEGAWPTGLTTFDLGRALRHFCDAAPPDALAELVRGWGAANDPTGARH